MENELIGVAGLGLLGRGIVACLLGHGFRVIAFTTGEDTHEKARTYITDALDEMLQYGVTTAELRENWRDNYQETETLESFAPCTFVIESVTEDAVIKLRVFDRLEAAIGVDVPIASNTSAIPISLLQSMRSHPERFLGMHWAQPAYATRFMELIRGEHTASSTLDQASSLAKRTGKDPVIVERDVPGFIVNRLGYAMYREAIHLLETGIADVEGIDRAFSSALGLWAPMCGPFRWMDITGGPALYAKVMEGLLPSLANSTELPATMREKLNNNERGVRDGRGFYEYEPGDEKRWEKQLHQQAWATWKRQKD